VIDPGETVTVSFRLAEHGLWQYVQSVRHPAATGGVTSPSGPQTYGVVTNGGATVVGHFHVHRQRTCGSNITATLQIQTNSVNYGTVTYAFTSVCWPRRFHRISMACRRRLACGLDNLRRRGRVGLGHLYHAGRHGAQCGVLPDPRPSARMAWFHQ